ncbi:MAG: lysophospholipid acyltransferase family protein [Myxococcota bacterium]
MSQGGSKLSTLERFHVQLVEWSLRNRRADAVLTWLQRKVGARWIDACTRRLRHVHGLDRILPYRERPILLVANHRSFFDMFLINAVLYREGGFRRRFLFPVRANFFYDSLPGFFVNGLVSFFSMYPPVFRDRKRAALNHQSFEALGRALAQAGRSAGVHPEGRRNTDSNPYTLLPPQSGIGRLVRASGVPVLPVFVNGLLNDIRRQILGNVRGDGPPIHVVFGAPVELDSLMDGPATSRAHRAVAERIMEAIQSLGEEERQLRAATLGPRPETDPDEARSS